MFTSLPCSHLRLPDSLTSPGRTSPDRPGLVTAEQGQQAVPGLSPRCARRYCRAAAVVPARAAGCRCRVPRCRVSCHQISTTRSPSTASSGGQAYTSCAPERQPPGPPPLSRVPSFLRYPPSTATPYRCPSLPSAPLPLPSMPCALPASSRAAKFAASNLLRESPFWSHTSVPNQDPPCTSAYHPFPVLAPPQTPNTYTSIPSGQSSFSHLHSQPCTNHYPLSSTREPLHHHTQTRLPTSLQPPQPAARALPWL